MMEIQSTYKIKNALEYMKPFFDVVRVVDTRKTKVMSFYPKTNSINESHQCYKVWNKQERCENCTSMSALLTGKQQEKYEFREDEVYLVISRPVKVEDEMGEAYDLILEIVNGVSDTSLFEKLGTNDKENKTIIELIEDTYRKIYEDPLTTVYNRRYLNEFKFLYHNNNQVAKKIAFIVVDLKKFKKINDTMGHEIGDRLLVKVASLFKENIGSQDSVIRIGGDEFVIVLVDCQEEQVNPKMQCLHNEIRKIKLDCQEQSCIDIDWGYAYTDAFEISKEYLDSMLKRADEAMYAMKEANIVRSI